MRRPAIRCCRGSARPIEGLCGFFKEHWPTSHATWLPGGSAPKAHALFKNPVLAETWKRMLREAEAVSGREAQIDAARAVFYRGFIAEEIDTFLGIPRRWTAAASATRA
jgi:gamma-glutamyltranspeptidase/glutathione hydrolase